MTTKGEVVDVSFQKYLTWAGIYLPLPAGQCDYRVEFDAQLLTPDHQMAAGEGWGYGIGPCDTWTGSWPNGFSLQYASYQGADSSQSNPGTFVDPDVNSGKPINISVDNVNHHWAVDVSDGRATFSMDYGGPTYGPYKLAGGNGLPADCHGRGVFLRVFNGEVLFSNIGIVAGSR